MSHKLEASIFCKEMIKSKNYINGKKENPQVGSLIKWNSIVFEKENIRGDNWYFCNEDENVVLSAKKQWDGLRIFDDEIFILE